MKSRKGIDGSKIIVVEDGDHIVIQPHEDTTSRWVDATVEARTIPIKAINSVVRAEDGCSLHVASQDGNVVMVDGQEMGTEPVITKADAIERLTTTGVVDNDAMWLRARLGIEDGDLIPKLREATVLSHLNGDEGDSYQRAVNMLTNENTQVRRLAQSAVEALERLSDHRRLSERDPSPGHIEPMAATTENASPPDQDVTREMSPVERIEVARQRLIRTADEVADAARDMGRGPDPDPDEAHPDFMSHLTDEPQPESHTMVDMGSRYWGTSADRSTDREPMDLAQVADGLDALAGRLQGDLSAAARVARASAG